jgi:hypothetical protein
MSRTLKHLVVGALAVAGAACAGDGITGPQSGLLLNDAFSSVPLGFSATNNTFAGSSDTTWTPRGGRDGRHGPAHGGGDGHGGPGDGMMGGGMGGLFMGDGFGPGFGHGRMGDPSAEGSCAFDPASGRVVCAPVTHDGLTINRSLAYSSAAGAVQQAFDSVTTNSINVRVSVAGAVTRRDGASSTVQHASDRTVSGLARGSTQRTVNGTSSGQETTTGSDSTGSFTAVRTVGDTTANVVVPVSTGSPTYPTAGTVTRSMRASVTYSGGTSRSSSRREVLTYDGTATARLVITQDGTTRTCSVPLPHGRPTCQ